jgi:hypothetical protein
MGCELPDVIAKCAVLTYLDIILCDTFFFMVGLGLSVSAMSECRVCNELYTSAGAHTPRLLACCGHTVSSRTLTSHTSPCTDLRHVPTATAACADVTSARAATNCTAGTKLLLWYLPALYQPRARTSRFTSARRRKRCTAVAHDQHCRLSVRSCTQSTGARFGRCMDVEKELCTH